MISRADCEALDAADPLRSLREGFILPPGVIYLDGNSLGAMPKQAPERAATVVTQEWGQGLIRSWNDAGWVHMPQQLGDRIAKLIGAGPGQVVVSDTTSINMYKVLAAALAIAAEDRPQAKVVISERTNFPTDLYIAQSLCQQHGYTLRLLEADEIEAAIDENLAVLMLTHVSYRTGAMYDMAAMSQRAHACGALVVWDLCHSVGAVEVDLLGAGADFSVGCTYKYLNGGPGSLAFAWVHPQHTDRFWQPLSGWFGHEAPFAFDPDYRPAAGIARYLCGTQPMVSLSLLDCGLAMYEAAEAFGGMRALRQKSLALSDCFIACVEAHCADFGFTVVTPREHARRGSHVSLTRAEGGYAIIQALIARGVIGDFRAGDGARHGDILRFGLTPLYLGFTEVWQAVEHLRDIMLREVWREPQYNQRHAVT